MEKRSQGGQYKRYKDIPMGSWEQTDRSDQSGEVSSTKEQFSMKKRENL